MGGLACCLGLALLSSSCMYFSLCPEVLACNGRHAVMLLQQQQLQQQVLSSASALQMQQQMHHDKEAENAVLQEKLASLQTQCAHLQDSNTALRHETSCLQTRIKEVGVHYDH